MKPTVTPCMGVWIETYRGRRYRQVIPSHPVWVCGLKHGYTCDEIDPLSVTPCMGVWIET